MNAKEIKLLGYELTGVIADVEQGDGFDPICLDTVKRVRDKLFDQATLMASTPVTAAKAIDNILAAMIKLNNDAPMSADTHLCSAVVMLADLAGWYTNEDQEFMEQLKYCQQIINSEDSE